MALNSLIDFYMGNGLAPSYVKRVYGEAMLRTGSEVLAIAFDPQGRLWSAEEQGILRCWSPEGRLQGRHYLSDLVTVWCFTADGRYVAGGSDELMIWEVSSGRSRATLGSGRWVTALAWDRTGRLLACGREDGRVEVWEVATESLVCQWPATGCPVAAITFSPDDTYLAIAGEDRQIRVQNMRTGELQAEWVGHPDRIAALTWSPDGRLLISAGWDNSARVWQLDQADPLMLLNSHAEQVVALAYSPDGHYLACADSDGAIHLWHDPVQAGLAGVLRGHIEEVRCLAFAPDGKKLASGAADGTIVLWDVEKRSVLAGGRPGHRHRLAYVAGPRPRLASVFSGCLQVWEADTGVPAYPKHKSTAHSVAASRDGRWLAVGGADHFTYLYDLWQDTEPAPLEATKPPIGQVVFDAEGRRLAHTSPVDGLVWIWDTVSRNPELILIEAADGCTLEGLCFHPDGQRLAAGGLDYLATGQRTGAVVVWHLPSREQQYVIDAGVSVLTVEPQGRWWAGAGTGGDIYIWRTSDGDELAVLASDSTARLFDLACSPCGRYLAASGEDQTIRIWTTDDGQLCLVREVEMPVEALLFSPDGRYLFAGLGNGMACAFDFTAFLDQQ